jgi:hypothetical protein
MSKVYLVVSVFVLVAMLLFGQLFSPSSSATIGAVQGEAAWTAGPGVSTD